MLSDLGNALGEREAGLLGANAEIREARRVELLRLLNERSCQAAIAATDSVIGYLEELNLQGRGKERLGRNAASQLERALAPVPRSLRPRIRARTVQRALEAVLETQTPLLEGRRQAHRARAGDSLHGAPTIAT